MPKIAVLGAGPAGLSAARYLTDYPDVQVDVIEKDDHLGGLQRSFEFEQRHFDVGTILFFGHHGLVEAFPFLADEMVPIKYKPVSINPAGSYDRYPFTIRRYLKDNGLFVAAWSLLDLLSSKIRCARKDSVAAYAKYYMGGTIYRRSGLQRYIYRLHDLEDEQLDVEFARKRLALIERQSLRRMLSAALPFTKTQKKTIAGGRLVRPPQGFEYMFDLIRGELENRKVDLQLGRQVQSVRKTESGFDVSVDGTTEHYDRVVSTIPIPTMLTLIGETPATDVQTKNLISLFYVGKFNRQGNTFFNFTNEADWKRITVFSDFYGPTAAGEDYFTVEITSDDTSPDRVDAVARDFEAHAEKVQLLTGAPRFQGSHVSTHAYPVYRRGQGQAVEAEKHRLRSFGIDLLGRQGNFEYVISNVVAKRAHELTETLAADQAWQK